MSVFFTVNKHAVVNLKDFRDRKRRWYGARTSSLTNKAIQNLLNKLISAEPKHSN